MQHESIQQQQQTAKLNRDIEHGLNSMGAGNTISASDAYNNIKSKIDEK